MSHYAFDSSQHTCRGNVIVPPRDAPHYSLDQVNAYATTSDHRSIMAYKDPLLDSPTSSPNQPLLTVSQGGEQVMVTVDMLTRTLKVMLEALDLDTSL